MTKVQVNLTQNRDKQGAYKKISEAQKRLPWVRKKWLAFLQVSDKRLASRAEIDFQQDELTIHHLECRITQHEKKILEIQSRIKKTRLQVKRENLQLDITRKNQEILYFRRHLLDLKKCCRQWVKKLQQEKQCRKRMLSGREHQIELDKILKLPLILAVDIDANKKALQVYTDTIYISYGKKLYEIGMFRITFCFRSPEILFVNLCSTHPFNCYHHPYVRNGSFCFGQHRDFVYNTLDKFEFSAAIQFILTALQTAAGDNTEAIAEWKDVTDEGRHCRKSKSAH